MTKREAYPAAVYAPGLSVDETAELYVMLGERCLYVSDATEERQEHQDRPVHERPQLVRRLVHARLGYARVFVADVMALIRMVGWDQRRAILVKDEQGQDHRYRGQAAQGAG